MYIQGNSFDGNFVKFEPTVAGGQMDSFKG